jgi:hypothetical protein
MKEAASILRVTECLNHFALIIISCLPSACDYFGLFDL